MTQIKVIQEIGIEDGEQTIDFSIEYFIQADTDETADTCLVAGIVILGVTRDLWWSPIGSLEIFNSILR